MALSLTLALSVPVTWWGWWWTHPSGLQPLQSWRKGRRRSEKAQWVRRRLSMSDPGCGLAEGFSVKLEMIPGLDCFLVTSVQTCVPGP